MENGAWWKLDALLLNVTVPFIGQVDMLSTILF